MDLNLLTRRSGCEWHIRPFGAMRVPGIIYGTEALVRDMDDKVYEQVTNVATLPGIVKASHAMPDAHWGYGFPIGGVAAFDPDHGGIISAGGVGFDISCGVRTLTTGLTTEDIEPVKERLADRLFQHVPAGVGSTGFVKLSRVEFRQVVEEGARWLTGELVFSDSRAIDLHSERRSVRAQFRSFGDRWRLERLRLGAPQRQLPEARP